MKLFRGILFSTHLVIGLAAGDVIAIVAFTGAAMAFEKQVIASVKLDLRDRPQPAAGTPLLSSEKLRRSGLAALLFRQAMRTLYRALRTGEVGEIVGQTFAFFPLLFSDIRSWPAVAG